METYKIGGLRGDITLHVFSADTNGLILYNSEKNDRTGDYLALQLNKGVPQFLLDAGGGPLVVDGDRPLQLNTWHTIRISKTNSKGQLQFFPL